MKKLTSLVLVVCAFYQTLALAADRVDLNLRAKLKGFNTDETSDTATLRIFGNEVAQEIFDAMTQPKSIEQTIIQCESKDGKTIEALHTRKVGENFFCDSNSIDCAHREAACRMNINLINGSAIANQE